jgi:hypothetical protein
VTKPARALTSRVGAGLPTGVGLDLQQHQNLWRCLALFGVIWTSKFSHVDSDSECALDRDRFLRPPAAGRRRRPRHGCRRLWLRWPDAISGARTRLPSHGVDVSPRRASRPALTLARQAGLEYKVHLRRADVQEPLPFSDVRRDRLHGRHMPHA